MGVNVARAKLIAQIKDQEAKVESMRLELYKLIGKDDYTLLLEYLSERTVLFGLEKELKSLS